MLNIYTPENTIEAYLLQGALQAEGISCEVHGEHLQGGAGLLPVNNNVTLRVHAHDVEAAQALIARYERGELSAD